MLETKLVTFDYGLMEKLMCSETKEDFTGFDAYALVAKKHDLKREDVKSASFWLFYGKSHDEKNPMKTKEQILLAVERACEMSGLIQNANRHHPMFETIGTFFKHHRREQNLSQTELSTLLGYRNGQFISNVERGLCSIPAKKILLLAEIFKIAPTTIIETMVEDYKNRLNIVVSKGKGQDGK